MTVVNPTGTGWLEVHPCDAGNYTASVLNFAVGQTIAHSTIAVADVDGQVCFHSSQSTKLVVDQYGYMGTTGAMIQFPPNSFTYTGGNGYGLGSTSAGFVETVVPGGQTELDAGYATLLGSPPPGTTSSPVWIGGHNSTHGAVFGHIDNIANGTIVSVKSGSTTYTNTIQGRYLATVGDPAPTGHTFFLQTSAPPPSVWLIHN